MVAVINNHYKNIILCLIGTFINAIGVNGFLLGSNLGDGGTVGISLALKYAFGFSPAITTLLINVVLIIIGWKFLSKKVAIYTVISNTALSLFLGLTKDINLGIDDFVINSVFGGAIIGISVGIVLSTGSTVGGPAVIARILNKYFGFKTAKSIFLLDSLIVLSFLMVLPLKNVLFTIIMLFITERATSFVIEGFNPKKAVTIISEHNEQIADQINSFTGRGSTILPSKGGYSKNASGMLYVVVPQSQVTKIKNLVYLEDDKAFLVIHDVRDVLGSTFINNIT
ncbi:YitT family protein [Staphylococcus arlettae]|uniref:YitT family protein n=1 Tax=Staphylococcus arlettae TaxID=29378 RepID=UPI001E5C16AD|nr:YitT family protein [Staphylococcus arlettae]MCD8849296.1 YitT family protein [Staphylococcus arlettae]MEB6067155.1 YitT family protein [Staphylococcus arlettae]